MIEQYNKEMSEVHAPAYLVERTRKAMKQEEEILKKEGVKPYRKTGNTSKKNRKKMVISLLTAAAALMLVLVPALVKDEGTQMPKPMQLSPKETKGLEKIELKGSADEKDGEESTLQITLVPYMPKEFGSAEELSYGEITYFLLVDKELGSLTAYVEKDGKNYLISGGMEDEESFLQEAEKLLSTK